MVAVSEHELCRHHDCATPGCPGEASTAGGLCSTCEATERTRVALEASFGTLLETAAGNGVRPTATPSAEIVSLTEVGD